MGSVNETVLDEAASDICSPGSKLKASRDMSLIRRWGRILLPVGVAEMENTQIIVLYNKSLIRINIT